MPLYPQNMPISRRIIQRVLSLKSFSSLCMQSISIQIMNARNAKANNIPKRTVGMKRKRSKSSKLYIFHRLVSLTGLS